MAADSVLLDRLDQCLAGTGITRRQLDRRYERVKAQAHEQLVAELGDPKPLPLA